MKKVLTNVTLISCILLCINGCTTDKKAVETTVIQTQTKTQTQSDNRLELADIKKVNSIDTDIGSILYGTDKNTIHIILNLNLIKTDGVKITFSNAESGNGAYLGEGNSLVSLGTIQNETTLVPMNNGLRLWSEFPIRLLDNGNQMFIKVMDSTNEKVILQQKLDF
ncbi:hypothetical protein [Paenibacillus sp.]|uniref:hypothetical protein n=1 Tax=Paenibacillus sp. TaxID=58172 RepID=UPI0028294715|nr:hypothetical protein [Paenibacillus sp.]MDR0270223.1 hypothetical protein [Paenibacillus sp.]